MDEEKVLDLFDVYWFYHKSNENPHSPESPPPPPPPPSPPPPNPIDPVPVQAENQIKIPPISRFPSHHRRSCSDQMSSRSDPFSPNSVLPTPKLETILSGKEVGETTTTTQQEEDRRPSQRPLDRRKKKGTRSLPDLEFEELKGFLDLGFTFSDADLDSTLVSIVPGLQRLGKTARDEEPIHESAVARPYLSEAWSFNRKEEDPLTDWTFSAGSDRIDLKDQLKHWAHAVASSVR